MAFPIVAACDPYSEDRAPVTLARAAAELTGSPVIAVAVYPWPMMEGFSDPYTLGGESEQVVSSSLRRLREDFGVETRVVNDLSVPRRLHLLARELQASLIVVGSSGRERTGRVRTGSTAKRLLHGSPCAVALATRGYESTRMATIAVGFVDSPEGQEVLAVAHGLAVRSGARLRVIAVLHPSGRLDPTMADGLRPQCSELLERRHRRDVQAALARGVAALTPPVDVECHLHVGDPAEVLLRVSEHVDLLVCGSRGYGPLRSVLLGGVSRRLVDGARCPVLVLPRGVGSPLDDLIDGSAVATAPMTAVGEPAGAVDVALRDGSTVRVRPVVDGDFDQLRALLGPALATSRAGCASSPPASTSTRWRAGRRAGAQAAATAWSRRVGAPERIVGHAAYVATAPGKAEIAFEVSEERHGLGIGTILLAHLAAVAPGEGIAALRGHRPPIQSPDGAGVPRLRLPGRA